MKRRIRIAVPAALLAVAGCASPAEQTAYDGATLFARHCAACHGRDGAGDGPMAPHLATALPDLRQISARNGGTFPREQIAAVIDGRSLRSFHGSTEMPVWGYHFTREEGATAAGERRVESRIDALVSHVESLQESAAPTKP